MLLTTESEYYDHVSLGQVDSEKGHEFIIIQWEEFISSVAKKGDIKLTKGSYAAKRRNCSGKERGESVVGNISLLIEFNDKRSLKIYGHIAFCLFMWPLQRTEKERIPPTSQGWPGITTGWCSSPVGCKDSHRTPASHRVTLRAGAKETAITLHCTPTLGEKQNPHLLPWVKSRTAPSLPITRLCSLWSPLSRDELPRPPLTEVPVIFCVT